MLNYKDKYNIFDENGDFEIGIFSTIGHREEQQDCSGYVIKGNEGIIVVCDGMGGHQGGRLASNLCVNEMLIAYEDNYPCEDLYNFYLDNADFIDRKVKLLKDNNGESIQAGSTTVSCIIRDKKLQWMSVGDSRLYLFRDGIFEQMTEDHNYFLKLNEQLNNDEITDEEYNYESKKGESLISFMGVGGLRYVDCNDTLIDLETNDRILITTDGLYKLLEKDEIKSIIENFNNVNEALLALESKAARASRNKNISRDNMTMALIKIK